MQFKNFTSGLVAAAVLFAVLSGGITGARAQEIDIPYEKFVLDNGLTLIVHEDHKAPIVAVNVWYHVGSKNEKEGKTGFAHLFEHLMFNGSERYKDDYFKPFDRVGATDMNGTTNQDRTNYFQNVPTPALDLVLWMESDRMGHLLGAIDQARPRSSPPTSCSPREAPRCSRASSAPRRRGPPQPGWPSGCPATCSRWPPCSTTSPPRAPRRGRSRRCGNRIEVEGGRRWAPVTVACQHLAGDPQWTMVAVGLGLLLALERAWSADGAHVRGAARALAAVVFGTGLAVVQLVPAWALLGESMRGTAALTPEEQTLWTLAPWRLLELVAPGFFRRRARAGARRRARGRARRRARGPTARQVAARHGAGGCAGIRRRRAVLPPRDG